MSSEVELKYAPKQGFSATELFSAPEIAPFLGEISEIEMKTEYLDTPTNDAKSRGISLRRRMENGKNLLYAKTSRLTSGELTVRGEWSVPSSDISRAAELLLEAGAPTADIVGLPLEVCGKVSFLRKEALLSLPAFSAMLSFDEGFFGEDTPFTEIELELKSGDTDELLRFSREIAIKYGFAPETLSKHARALKHFVK